MAETLVAHEQQVAKIFSDDYVFQIPGFQRPYAWTTEQAEELFDDLVTFMQTAGGLVEDMPPYFLGSIVLIKQENAPKSGRRRWSATPHHAHDPLGFHPRKRERIPRVRPDAADLRKGQRYPRH